MTTGLYVLMVSVCVMPGTDMFQFDMSKW